VYPILFKIGSFPVHTYGAVHALAYAAGIWWLLREARNAGLRSQQVYDLSMVIVVWSIVGARVFSVLFDGNIGWYVDHPVQMLAIWKGGLTFYGGFLFALAAGVWYVKKHRLNGWRIADAMAPAIALGAAIGRLGCFASGDSYGKPTNLPWSVVFSDPMSLAPTGIPLHPTQLYSVLANLTVFVMLLLWKKHARREGAIFLLFVLLYAALRSIIEVFRDDPRGVYFGATVSTSQIISLAAAVLAGFLLFSLPRQAKEGLAGRIR